MDRFICSKWTWWISCDLLERLLPLPKYTQQIFMTLCRQLWMTTLYQRRRWNVGMLASCVIIAPFYVAYKLSASHWCYLLPYSWQVLSNMLTRTSATHTCVPQVQRRMSGVEMMRRTEPERSEIFTDDVTRLWWEPAASSCCSRTWMIDCFSLRAEWLYCWCRLVKLYLCFASNFMSRHCFVEQVTLATKALTLTPPHKIKK